MAAEERDWGVVVAHVLIWALAGGAAIGLVLGARSLPPPPAPTPCPTHAKFINTGVSQAHYKLTEYVATAEDGTVWTRSENDRCWKEVGQ